MRKIYFALFVLALLIIVSPARSQNIIHIPAYTGYAVPAENDDADMFTADSGLANWTNSQQYIQYIGMALQRGAADVFINIRSLKGASLQISVAGKSFAVPVPVGNAFQLLHVGKVFVQDSGKFIIKISCTHKNGVRIAEIQSLQINCSNAGMFFFNNKERRNAASVHLMYPLPANTPITAFYNEIKVPAGSDLIHSYFMACGFARGYFGMQVNGPDERRIIFSVWDAGDEANDRNKVSDSNRVRLLAKGDDVIASDFGNEGTGGHSHWIYNWHADSVYKFLVTVSPDTIKHVSTYTAYFYVPEMQQWKMIASFSAPKDGEYLHHLYSFLENFSGVNGQQYRKAYFGNQWVQTQQGQWLELTKASFSCDATGRAKDRIDFGGGAAGNEFYLWNGGFQFPDANYGDSLTRTANNQPPATVIK